MLHEVGSAKFLNSISLAGREYFFLDVTKHPVKMAFDEATKEIVLFCKKTSATRRTPINNVIYYEISSEQKGGAGKQTDGGQVVGADKKTGVVRAKA